MPKPIPADEPTEDPETLAWWRLTPAQRFQESQKLWSTFVALGGSLDPEPDWQSPFYVAETSRPRPAHGGQACILYGAAEFSRAIDIAILASDANLDRLRKVLAELGAEALFVPALGKAVLLRGHACHFRLHVPEAEGIRLDVMSVMHGCDSFEQLWKRRRTLTLPGVGRIHVLALADLVRAKQTQRDKDWPMVRRLIEVDFHNRPRRPSQGQIQFWLREARTPALLVELCRRYPGMARRISGTRPAVRWAMRGNLPRTETALRVEEDSLRADDRAYWQPLRGELLHWRRSRM
jgi:hypothetical protein